MIYKTVRVPLEKYNRIKDISAKTGLSLNKVLELALASRCFKIKIKEGQMSIKVVGMTSNFSGPVDEQKKFYNCDEVVAL